jgi:glycolate oxidase iron-sulfur subunit
MAADKGQDKGMQTGQGKEPAQRADRRVDRGGGRAESGLLEKARKSVSRCDRCGTCLTVCPLFKARDVESSAARGKNQLTRALAEGVLAPSPELLKAANFCLLCRACTANCPNQIATDDAMVDVRQYLVEATGAANLKYRAVGAFLKSRAGVAFAAGALALLRRTGLNRIFPYGMAPDQYTRAHYLAAFAGPAALGGPAPPSPAVIGAQTRVAYFNGCGMQMMFPEAATQTLAILRTTTQPLLKRNVCCGLPHLAHGRRGDFVALARRNIRIYEDTDLVVSDCASCGATLKHLGRWLADDPAWKERAAAFSAKVMDLTEYLAKVGYQPRRRVAAKLTYHDPCHLVRGQGISGTPRELLRAAGDYVEMEEAAVCCSGAGSFHMDYPGVAAAILDRKREHIEQTGAAAVVTGCPGCLIRLAAAARGSRSGFRALHISQVI